MCEPKLAAIGRASNREGSFYKCNNRDNADRHPQRPEYVGGIVSHPDWVGGMGSSDPTSAYGKDRHQSLLVWARTRNVFLGSPPLCARAIAPESSIVALVVNLGYWVCGRS